MSRMRWGVYSSYLVTLPAAMTFDLVKDIEEVMAELQKRADEKRRGPPIGPLGCEVYSDQVKVYFNRNGKRRLFCTLMP